MARTSEGLPIRSAFTASMRFFSSCANCLAAQAGRMDLNLGVKFSRANFLSRGPKKMAAWNQIVSRNSFKPACCTSCSSFAGSCSKFTITGCCLVILSYSSPASKSTSFSASESAAWCWELACSRIWWNWKGRVSWKSWSMLPLASSRPLMPPRKPASTCLLTASQCISTSFSRRKMAARSSCLFCLAQAAILACACCWRSLRACFIPTPTINFSKSLGEDCLTYWQMLQAQKFPMPSINKCEARGLSTLSSHINYQKMLRTQIDTKNKSGIEALWLFFIFIVVSWTAYY